MHGEGTMADEVEIKEDKIRIPVEQERRERSLREGEFRKGVDVMPQVQVSAEEAPSMGGLPAADQDGSQPGGKSRE
jgi:hypothetical protein